MYPYLVLERDSLIIDVQNPSISPAEREPIFPIILKLETYLIEIV